MLPRTSAWFAWLLTLGCVLGLSTAGLAANCALPPFGYGECILATAPHPGELPFAATYVEGDDPYLLVADLFTGMAYRYRFQYDVVGSGTLIEQTSFIGPLGAGTTSGLAWHPGENKLYWLIDGHLVRSDLDGRFEEDLGEVLSPEGGQLGDLAIDPLSGTFWTLDVENDLYFAFAPGADGIDLTGGAFSSPAAHPDGGGAYGGGLDFVDIDGEGYLDIAAGRLTDLRASEVLRVTPDGADTGAHYALEGLVAGFPTGIAYRRSEARTATEFIVDASLNMVIEVPAEPPETPGVADLACAADHDAGEVALTWRNPAAFDAVQIEREADGDRETVATLAGDAEAWTDTSPPAGVLRYTVTASPGSGAPARSCEVVYGFGHLVNKAPHGGTDPFAITVAEAAGDSPAQVIVADLDGAKAYAYTKALEPAGEIDAPFPASRTLGIAWERDTDRLLWVKELEQATALVFTARDGSGASEPFALPAPLFRAAIGDITGDPNGCAEHEELGDEHTCPDDPDVRVSFYWAVDLMNDLYFEFKITENLAEETVLAEPTGRIIDHPLGGGWGQGIATVVAETFSVFDLPVGEAATGFADRVVRILPSNLPAGAEYGLVPTTGSAFVEGIAWTAEGSLGTPAEYIVANDANTIYEVSLEVAVGGVQFIRGDANGDNRVNISDPSSLLFYLFAEGEPPTCLKAADANDDGRVNISDASYILIVYLFAADPSPPPAPFPLCGSDPTEDPLGCEEYTCP